MLKLSTYEFSGVYRKRSDCNGRRNLEGFVWEKQLLQPSHALFFAR